MDRIESDNTGDLYDPLLQGDQVLQIYELIYPPLMPGKKEGMWGRQRLEA